MLNLDEINRTILDLENHDTTYATCEKLAWLYTVRDHLQPVVESVAKELTPQNDESDFLMACSNVDVSDLLNILNEHMDVVKIIMPKEYESLMTKIKELA